MEVKKMNYKKQSQLQLYLSGIINGGDKSFCINNLQTSRVTIQILTLSLQQKISYIRNINSLSMMVSI